MPELVSGELEFRSQAENREEFLQIIATGGYDEFSARRLPGRSLSTYLHMFIVDVDIIIREGYQAFQIKSTPESWHEAGGLNLVLGVDFFIWDCCSNCFASFDEYDKHRSRRFVWKN